MNSSQDSAIRKGIDFRSVDSQPEGLSVKVSTLRAPALLITFSILSVVQLWLFETGFYDWVLPQRDYVFAPYTGEHSIAIRTYVISFYISFSIYASGSVTARMAFGADLVLRFLAICAVLDLLNSAVLSVFGQAYPLSVVQIVAGLIGFALFSLMLMGRGAMPVERPVKIGEQQNLRMLLRFIATAAVAGFLSAFIGSFDSVVIQETARPDTAWRDRAGRVPVPATPLHAALYNRCGRTGNFSREGFLGSGKRNCAGV